ncbi:hypothetical protein HYFRA_00002253 [Hymenoscyphus fraxineus]|uniref:AB hydrolase-1 domain-containing protein n=1 Tax=Hymenoscyphus fraxineus TaxID=746836 RepID=A0A9N9LC29_9HELO|nr:hypothetical protein HYFRA_00002253 [Hymenoscyphus fraxineus]
MDEELLRWGGRNNYAPMPNIPPTTSRQPVLLASQMLWLKKSTLFHPLYHSQSPWITNSFHSSWIHFLTSIASQQDSVDDIQYITSLDLESNIESAAKDKIFFYHRGVKELSHGKPILMLLHGYPQTWRHVVALLPQDIPQFIPDLPRYGRSSPLSIPHDKRNVGHAILKALYPILPPSHEPTPIILAGHDCGARICHRLAVNTPCFSRFTFKGTILMDIALITGHLANLNLATAMINSLGAETFIKSNIERWAGSNPAAVARSNEQDAKSVYTSSFKYDSVIKASCDDYRAGAFEDVTQQEEDQRAGKKLDVDVLALYSAGYLGSRYDVEEVWREWMGSGVLEVIGFGDGVGHFIAEEAPGKTSEAIQRFYTRHG